MNKMSRKKLYKLRKLLFNIMRNKVRTTEFDVPWSRAISPIGKL